MLTGAVFAEFVNEGIPKMTEGSHVGSDLRFALEHGVALRPDYGDFLDRYRDHRDNVVASMEAALDHHDKMPWPLSSMYDVRNMAVELRQDPKTQDRIHENLDPDKNSSVIQAKLLREFFRDFEVMERFTNQDTPKQKADLILGELDAGRPVAVSYFLDPLHTDAHALVIQGYTTTRAGDVVFQTRNSWGPMNNPRFVYGNQASGVPIDRVFAVTSLREKPLAGKVPAISP